MRRIGTTVFCVSMMLTVSGVAASASYAKPHPRLRLYTAAGTLKAGAALTATGSFSFKIGVGAGSPVVECDKTVLTGTLADNEQREDGASVDALVSEGSEPEGDCKSGLGPVKVSLAVADGEGFKLGLPNDTVRLPGAGARIELSEIGPSKDRCVFEDKKKDGLVGPLSLPAFTLYKGVFRATAVPGCPWPEGKIVTYTVALEQLAKGSGGLEPVEGELCGCTPGREGDALFSAVKQFSTATNPNGAWSYLYEEALFTQTNCCLDTLSYWENGRADPTFASLAANSTGTTQSFDTVVLPPYAVDMNPEATASVAVRWTAPEQGIYNVKGHFAGIDLAQVTHPVAIFVNGAEVYSNTISDYKQWDRFELGVSVPAGGETITFLTETSPTSYQHLSTGLTVRIKREGSF
jgi:hypothetical protein